MAADPITAADVRAAAQDVYDRLKHEMAAQARNTLLNDLSLSLNDLAAKLGEMELHDDTGDRFDAGYMVALAEIRAWMNEQARTEGEA